MADDFLEAARVKRDKRTARGTHNMVVVRFERFGEFIADFAFYLDGFDEADL